MNNANWWIIACASLAAAGMVFILTAGRPRPPRGLAARLGLVQVEQRRPLVDRLFGHLAEQVFNRRGDHSALITQLQRAGMYQRAGAQYPDERVFYAYKLAIAAFLGVLGMGAGLLAASILEAAPTLSLGFALAGSVAGFLLPDMDLRGKAATREDQMIADMSTALDRLANFLASGSPLPQAINELAARPGGVFVRELALVAGAYNTGTNLADALLEMQALNGNLSVLIPFVTLCNTAQRMGGGVSGNLRELATKMREDLTERITRRGYRNTVLMVGPVFLALISVLLVIAAPGVSRAFAGLASGGF